MFQNKHTDGDLWDRLGMGWVRERGKKMERKKDDWQKVTFKTQAHFIIEWVMFTPSSNMYGVAMYWYTYIMCCRNVMVS